MKSDMKYVYAFLAFLGTVLPLSAFLPWLGLHGLAPRRFVQELFANRVSAFFALDVIVSALVVFCFAYAESRAGRLRRPWIPMLATLLVGGSLGLPLLLFMRDPSGERRGSDAAVR